jgi:hypothetical protein
MKSVDLIQSDRWLRVVCAGVATLLTVCVAVVLMAILYPASTLVSDVQAGPISSSAQAWLLTSGGPDAFGYTFKDSNEPDGPTYAWEEISSTGTQVIGWTGTDDGYAGPIPIGFDFNFYGNNYDELHVGSNGYLSFGRGYGAAALGRTALTGAAQAASSPALSTCGAIRPLWGLGIIISRRALPRSTRAWMQGLGTTSTVRCGPMALDRTWGRMSGLRRRLQ